MFLLQPFDQREQFLDSLDDAVLLGEWRQRDKKAFNSGYCQLGLPDLRCCLCNLLLNQSGLKHFNEPILIHASENKPICIFGQICTVEFVWDFSDSSNRPGNSDKNIILIDYVP